MKRIFKYNNKIKYKNKNKNKKYMGNFWKDSEMSRDEVLNNIYQINQISKTLAFMKELNIHLIFELDDQSSKRRKSRKIIKVTIYDYNHNNCMVQKRKKPLHITIDNFYKYFNIVMNSRSMFVANQLNESFQKGDTLLGEDESGICPICSENKVNLSLPCSHFFCENCIKTWLVKSESCPLCRLTLKINNNGPSGIAGAQTWNVLDEFDQEELEKENMESLKSLTQKLFKDNK